MTSGSERIDISVALASICGKLGIDLAFVRELTIRPTDATVVLFQPDAAGDKHIDAETGEVATQTLTFEVRT